MLRMFTSLYFIVKMSLGFFHNDRVRWNKTFSMEFCIPVKTLMLQLPSLMGKYNKKETEIKKYKLGRKNKKKALAARIWNEVESWWDKKIQECCHFRDKAHIAPIGKNKTKQNKEKNKQKENLKNKACCTAQAFNKKQLAFSCHLSWLSTFLYHAIKPTLLLLNISLEITPWGNTFIGSFTWMLHKIILPF